MDSRILAVEKSGFGRLFLHRGAAGRSKLLRDGLAKVDESLLAQRQTPAAQMRHDSPAAQLAPAQRQRHQRTGLQLRPFDPRRHHADTGGNEQGLALRFGLNANETASPDVLDFFHSSSAGNLDRDGPWNERALMRFAVCFVACVLGWLPAFGAEVAPAAGVTGGASTAPPDSTRTAAASGAGHYALVHGLKMYYEIHGQGPALLVLHGGMSSIPVWPEAIEYFSREYQVITPEQMGHGRTADDPTRPMDYHAMAEDTAELMSQLKIGSAYVLGHSDGGIVGLDLAINHPGLVKKLALSGANYSPPPPAKPGAVETTAADIPKFIREPYERLSPDGAAYWPVLFARVHRMWQTQPNFSHAQLAGIVTPVLVIAGDHDFVSPEYTVEMWRAIPGAELWIAPNSNHGLPIRRAALFNLMVDTFFKEPLSKQP